MSFKSEYNKLNPAQKQAVNNIEGPMLVLAGPGTGKTQLLSLRVANIINQTDTNPGNILCLTFTDNAARNMRERLESVIGQAAYHVNIHTFHSFGVEIINQFPDFFTSRQLLQQIDELGSYELLREIFESLPHSNPLAPKIGDEFVMLRDTLSIIGWLKQNALTPTQLHAIIEANEAFMKKLAPDLAKTFESPTSSKNLTLYQSLLKKIEDCTSQKQYWGFADYGVECASELRDAIDTIGSSRWAPSLTKWRNKWCEKNARGQHVFKDSGRNMRKMHAVANVYEQLEQQLSRQGLYDFDDMIIETVGSLEANQDLRSNLQERYLYIMVDEFQDTNKAQLRMLQALGDNKLYEGRPNIMAVGDDDQAIYAFQGAEASNMATFVRQYNRPTIINLSENYRSSPEILNASFEIANQISNRLETILPGTRERLVAKAHYVTSQAHQMVFPSELAQYDWLAQQISQAIKKGTKPEDIAVIAPRHRYLERLMPYLGAQNISVAYERRENVLEAPLIVQLLSMGQLVVALENNRQDEVDTLFGQVLSFDFWGIDTKDLVSLSLECYNKHNHWLPTLLESKNKLLQSIAVWFVQIARRSTTEPLEYILDQLMGEVSEGIDSEYDEQPSRPRRAKFISPMRQFYFSQKQYQNSTDNYLALLGQLSTLRQRLRQWKPNRSIYINDLINFAQLHIQAKLKIIDTNPHTQSTNAVQVMTAYKSKGLEFGSVYAINAQDEIWGPTARSRSLRLTLPRNLPIAPASDGDNDKLRLLYVALSRAKHDLIITSYTHSLDNKPSPGLSFIGGNAQSSRTELTAFQPNYIDKPANARAVEILSTDWAYRGRQIIADKPTLLEPILANYKLSVTHLNNFIDIVSGGPEFFLIHNLLRFPQALTPAAAYGDSIHKSLQWANQKLRETDKLPSASNMQSYFIDMLERKHLRLNDYKRLAQRGKVALERYLSDRPTSFNAGDLIERGFNNEGAVINDARLSGKIDKMHFIGAGSLQVVDFKTGQPVKSWQGRDTYEKVKLHKYRQQLLFYKLLVEHSASFGKKLSVESGELEFIEADREGDLVDNLHLKFNLDELDNFTKLITAVWQHIMTLDFPDVSVYPKNMTGVMKFEEDLISGKI